MVGMKPVYLHVCKDPSLLTRLVAKTVDALEVPRTAIVNSAALEMDLHSSLLFEPVTVLVVSEPDAGDQKTIMAYLKEPRDDLVLVISSTKPSVNLGKAVSNAGGEVVNFIEKRSADVARRLLGDANMTPEAKNFIVDHVGEDISLIPALLQDLADAYDMTGQPLTATNVAPWVGKAGSTPVWTILDAIDAQRTSDALHTLDRMWDKTSPVAMVAVLKGHLERIYRIQQAGITNEQEAATFLELKGASTYPARKAITLATRYKSAAEVLVTLAAQTDAAVRGGKGSGVPSRLAVEVLIARMCTTPRR